MRPGPIQGDMVHPYLRRRHGDGADRLPAPRSAARRCSTRRSACRSSRSRRCRSPSSRPASRPGEADQLRRAMATFKRVGTIDKFREQASSTAWSATATARIRRALLPADRGLRRLRLSRRATPPAFALLVYVSAWLKCHYPAAFAAALLNSQPMGFYAPAQIVRDAQRARRRGAAARRQSSANGIATLEPGPRAAERLMTCTATCARTCAQPRDPSRAPRDQGSARGRCEVIVQRRGSGYDSVRDLWLRTGLSPRVLERLADADAFRSLGLTGATRCGRSRRSAASATRG